MFAAQRLQCTPCAKDTHNANELDWNFFDSSLKILISYRRVTVSWHCPGPNRGDMWTSENPLYANFSERRKGEVRRIPLPRTPVNSDATVRRQAPSGGIMGPLLLRVTVVTLR